jgi:hypothetical protein
LFLVGCVSVLDVSGRSLDVLLYTSSFVGRIEIQGTEETVLDGKVCGYRYRATVLESLKGDQETLSFFVSLRPPIDRSKQQYFAVLFAAPSVEATGGSEEVRCVAANGGLYMMSSPLTLLGVDSRYGDSARLIVSEGADTMLSGGIVPSIVGDEDVADAHRVEYFRWETVRAYVLGTLARMRPAEGW